MKVSIIMSAYNAQETVKRAIDSVLCQTYKDLELIVVNDASTDSTDEIVRQYSDERIKYIKHRTNKGAGLARRDGIHKATGDYITFLDSDDYYAEDCIETLVNATNNGEIDIVSPGYIVVRKDGEEKKVPTPTTTDGDLYIYDESRTLHFLTIQLIRRSLFNNVEYSDRRFIEDSSTFIKILYYAKNRRAIDYAGYYYVQYADSLIHGCSPYKNFIYNMLCAKDTCVFYAQVGDPDKYKLRDFLIKWLSMPPVPEDKKGDADQYKKEKRELLKFITEQFDKSL